MPRSRQPKPRTSESRKQVASPDESWFTIRAILDERRVKGRIEYLVDWDDDETTGEAYAPTWSREVTDQAKEEWENTKASRNAKRVEHDSQDSSQPPRPANWRQIQKNQTAGPPDEPQPRRRRRRRRAYSAADESERPSKVAKVVYSPAPSEEPVPSIASLSCTESGVDGASDPGSASHPIQGNLDHLQPRDNLVVQFHKNSQFDPSEYSSQYNTQTSGGLSSQSIAELESQDDCLIVTSQPSRQTIPDSQEPSGQTWSLDLQHVEHEPPVESSLESRNSFQVDDDYPASDFHQDDEFDSGNLSGHCVRETTGHSSGHSNDRDIPSHQPDQRKSLSSASRDFGLTTPTDKSKSKAQSPGVNNDVDVVSDSSPVPTFLSQPPLPFSFLIPESSLSESQDSPAATVIGETPSNREQNSASASGVAEYLTESQDAQVVPTTSFVSHVAAFTDSHGTDKGGSPIVTAQISSPQKASSKGPSQPSSSSSRSSPSSPVASHDKMDSNQAARTPSDLAPQSSAVDELSQLLNLDSVMATMAEKPASPQPHSERPPGDVAGPCETLLPDPAAQASPRHGQQSQLEEHIDQSEHTQPKLLDGPLPSAVQSLQGIVDTIFHGPDLPALDTIVPDATHNSEPATVSLADISTPQNLEGAALPLVQSLLSQERSSPVHLPRTDPLSSAAVPVPVAPSQADEESDDESSDSSRESIVLKHTVTLPFQASLRPLYDDTLLEYKKEVTQFGDIFNREEYVEPDEALVYKIDQVLGRLHNICDYPPDVVGSTLEELPSNQLIKYCCDGNAKFNFLFELLQGLTKETRILIVARSVELLKLLYRLAEALGIECICEDLGQSSKAKSGASVARMTLILPERNVDEDDFDVVVGYDHSFGSSEIGKKLEPEIPDATSPLVLMLVTTHSIEHIDLYVPSDLATLERKNALVSGIVRARRLVGDPDRGYPEPHELASLFLDYLNGLVEGIIWDPVPLPEEILDIYVNSQSRSQMPAIDKSDVTGNARKRKLDDSDDEDAKRPRLLPFKRSTAEGNDVPVPDDVQALLSSVKPTENISATSSKGVVSVPVAVLQALAEQVSELRRQVDAADKDAQYKSLISGLESQIKEYARTSAKLYSCQREALEDRTKFERQAQKAEAALHSATESARKDAEKAQKRIADLETTVTRLTAGQDGSGETPLAQTQKLLEEAQQKTQTLEKRLENAHKDADYARSLYQDATATSSALRGENLHLKEQVTDLGKKTEETLGKVHAIQADAAVKQYLLQIRNLKAQLRQRDIELDCTKDELRLLKNGRRETRQVSVPRSPRMGMMSPRTGRVTHGSSTGNSGGASASRAGSPATSTPAAAAAADGGVPLSGTLGGMQFMTHAQSPGNGRWRNHLRE
ncbi:hypothetical protein E4U55_002887 [Claviceps digitariae]|nr:hypothetical protein E4U55_002887 [Claviceps digitariae]